MSHVTCQLSHISNANSHGPHPTNSPTTNNRPVHKDKKGKLFLTNSSPIGGKSSPVKWQLPSLVVLVKFSFIN